jgi:Tol biopolymer transport system component/tRNA A-37 threonylcarbamoyl transferase component Bud32
VVGKVLGHYRIVEKLGEGGMGVVYKARDLHLDRFAALKILPPDKLSDPDRRLRFIQEAKAASALNHANIVTVYDIAEEDGIHFIAMEYVEGKTLDFLIRHRGLTLGETLRYAVQIADALSAAHAAGIVHRDLKPANVIITEKEQAKVLDFGLAKLLEKGLQVGDAGLDSTMSYKAAQAPRTDAGMVVGTVAYMSPEQAQGLKIDARSDIFSFGAVLYEMITRQCPFKGETKMSTLAAIIDREPRPPSELVEGLPREVERIVALCLRKDPARRYQHMDDLKVALEMLKEDSDSGRLAATVPGQGMLRGGLRFRRIATVMVVIVALGLAAATWLFLRSRSRPSGSTPAGETALGGHLTLLVSSENAVSDPAISPDGKMLAYTAVDQGRQDLFVGRVAGGGRIRLTNDDSGEASPRFSPDGEAIVYTRLGAGMKVPELWLVPTLGGQAVRAVESALDATWSPDGKRLAFVIRRPGEGEALGLSGTDGTNLSIIMRSDAAYPFFRHPSWSPDGKQLAVARSLGGVSSELWLVPLDGSPPRRLSSDPPAVFSDRPVFTPDAKGLVHQSNRSGATNLWIMPLDGGPPRRLTAGPGPDELPSIARNGAMVFVNERWRSLLIVHNLGTGETREILAHNWYLWAPAISPDGREVAFSRSEKDGSWHIWMVPTAGGAPRQLTSGPLPEVYPRFTPDGSSVVYHTWSPEPDRIWRVPLAGGPPAALTPARDDDDGYADVSPDGKWLAFARSEKGRTCICVAPLEGGEARRLTDLPSTVPRWSPDGRFIAFSPNRGLDGGVFLIGAKGNDQRRISETGGWPVWWGDGKRLGFRHLGPEGSQEILTISLEGGPVKPLRSLRFKGANDPFDISFDGTILATTDFVQFSSEIWLLELQR